MIFSSIISKNSLFFYIPFPRYWVKKKWIVRLLNIFVAGFNPILLGAPALDIFNFFITQKLTKGMNFFSMTDQTIDYGFVFCMYKFSFYERDNLVLTVYNLPKEKLFLSLFNHPLVEKVAGRVLLYVYMSQFPMLVYLKQKRMTIEQKKKSTKFFGRPSA